VPWIRRRRIGSLVVVVVVSHTGRDPDRDANPHRNQAGGIANPHRDIDCGPHEHPDRHSHCDADSISHRDNGTNPHGNRDRAFDRDS